MPVRLDDGRRGTITFSPFDAPETEIVEGYIGGGWCLRFEMDIQGERTSGILSGRDAHRIAARTRIGSDWWPTPG